MSKLRVVRHLIVVGNPAGADRFANQRVGRPYKFQCLPNATWNDHLQALAFRNIDAQSLDLPIAAFIKHVDPHRRTDVEIVNCASGHAMKKAHRIFRGEQIVDHGQ